MCARTHTFTLAHTHTQTRAVMTKPSSRFTRNKSYVYTRNKYSENTRVSFTPASSCQVRLGEAAISQTLKAVGPRHHTNEGYDARWQHIAQPDSINLTTNYTVQLLVYSQTSVPRFAVGAVFSWLQRWIKYRQCTLIWILKRQQSMSRTTWRAFSCTPPTTHKHDNRYTHLTHLTHRHTARHNDCLLACWTCFPKSHTDTRLTRSHNDPFGRFVTITLYISSHNY